jgi:hypothetical protein
MTQVFLVSHLEVIEHGFFHFIPYGNQLSLLKIHFVIVKLRSHVL